MENCLNVSQFYFLDLKKSSRAMIKVSQYGIADFGSKPEIDNFCWITQEKPH